MRIISGKNKGKRINVPKKLPIRPTTDQSKEAIFNIIQNRYNFESIKVLDLYAGSGNISYEFSSRGVDHITSIDNNHKCVNFIKSISNDLNLNINVKKTDVFKFLKTNTLSYDIIFCDPPYELKNFSSLLYKWASSDSVKKNTLYIYEKHKNMPFNALKGLDIIEKKQYGISEIIILKIIL